MAGLEKAVIGSLPSGWPGYLLAVLTIVVAFLTNWRKGKIDESALVLGKWKELVQAHEGQIKRLNDDFDSFKQRANSELERAHAEIERLQNRIKEIEDEFTSYRKAAEKQIRQRDEEIAGLKSAIRQNSQSAAMLLGDPLAAAETKAFRKKRGEG